MGESDSSGTKTSGTITSIEIIGLKRTKPSIARYPLEKFLGREGSGLDFNEVQAAVRDTGILEPISAELLESGEGLILRLTVREKWSIFPFPMVFATSDEAIFGLFIADLNAFGLRDRAALGATYGSSGWMAMAMYQHTPSGSGIPGVNGSFMYARLEKEDADRNEKIFRRYTQDMLRFSLGLYYPFSDYFSASGTASFLNVSLKKNDSMLNPPENGEMLLGFSPGLAVKYSSWDGFLLSQRSLSLGYSYNLAISGVSFHQAEVRFVLEQPLLPGFRLILKSGAVWKSAAGSGMEGLLEEGPQKAQVDILPRKFAARAYAGFSSGLEKYLIKTSWGTLSVLGSWQCVFSEGSISGREFDNGPYGGIRFYLSRLALPALGTGLAYNMNSGLFQFTFSLGMDF